MKVQIEIPDGAVPGTKVAGVVVAASGNTVPDQAPQPKPQGAPISPCPADGQTRSFNGMNAHAWVSTYAGGKGRFSAAVPSGNAYWVVKVNGSVVIQGGMDMIPVNEGDAIEWTITTPEYQDKMDYTISLPA